MHAEKATLRKEGLRTEEVAATTLFLLSPRSSGLNGQGLVVDAGMGSNYFDAELLGG
jgi:enoyl-[acyl-carrier protein] reductase I